MRPPFRDGKIDAEELEHVFKQLNHKCKKVCVDSCRFPTRPRDGGALTSARSQADIEDMIWEVDDDCDKAVSWAEFQAMFTRCRNDKSGAWERLTPKARCAPSIALPRVRARPEAPRSPAQATSPVACTTSWSSL